MPSPPRIAHSDDVFRLATWQNVSILDLAGSFDIARMKRLAEVHRALIASYPKGIVTCAILRKEAQVSSREVLNEATSLLKELGGSTLMQASVLEQRDLMAQVMRTAVRGFNVVTRSSKIVMFATVDEAVKALAPHVVPPDPKSNVATELATAIATVRKGYAPAAAGATVDTQREPRT